MNLIGKTLILKEKAIRTAKQVMAIPTETDKGNETEFKESKKNYTWNDSYLTGFGGLLLEEDDHIGDDFKTDEHIEGSEECSWKEEGSRKVQVNPLSNTGECSKRKFCVQKFVGNYFLSCFF